MAKLPKFSKFSIPKDLEVPFGAITPAPIKCQNLFITGNWRVFRPVIDHAKCTRCLTCYMACPDACWTYNEQADKIEYVNEFCKGCMICVHDCPVQCISPIPELDFPDGVVQLEKPF
jgi:pyruvate ferredoxin oxidoreductase delta subunit